MNLTTSISTCFSKYATFEGTASRSEFWWFVAFWGFGCFLTAIIPIIGLVFGLACFIPYIAVTNRRLHDAGFSGWWQLLHLTIIGSFVVLIMCIFETKTKDNKYRV